MKKLFTSAAIIALSIMQISAQDFQKAPERVFKGENADKGIQSLCDTTISFDEANSSAISNVTVGYMHFNNDELRFYKQGLLLNGVQFYINDSAFDSVGVEIYENVSSTNGGSSNSQLNLGALVYDSIIPKAQVLASSINLHELNVPLVLDTAIGYAVGIRVFTGTGDFFLGVDPGPALKGKGDWILSGGNIVQLWSISSLDYNWNIKACISGPKYFPNYSVKLNSVDIDPVGYALLPLNHVDPAGYNYSGQATNNGLLDLTDPTLTATITPGTYSESGTAATLDSGMNVNLTTTTPFIPTSTGTYSGTYELTINESDFLLADNLGEIKSFTVTDSIYGRIVEGDNAIGTTDSYALDSDEDNIFGVRFDLQEDNSIAFITADFENPYEGSQYIGEIYDYDAITEEVGALLVSSDTMEFVDVIEDEIYSPIIGFNEDVYLLEGSYIVAIHELDGFELTGIMMSSKYNFKPGVAFLNSTATGNDWFDNGDFWVGDFVWSNRLHLGKTLIVDGISADLNNNLSIYPNPANGNVTVSNVEAGSTIQILDVTGKVVSSETVRSTATTIDLSTINKGMYVVKVLNNNSVATQKLIVE